ncbi:hypothetical protein VZT92_001444 [Zoarces viviparus]|uniref:Uncharacterized protein n=1 Tax=Zoarces viviparus TaxID=48416 RepID=A0AAW1G2K1_ZOAVI
MATPRARRGIRRIPKLDNEGFLNPTVELSISRSLSITDSRGGVFLKRRREKKKESKKRDGKSTTERDVKSLPDGAVGNGRGCRGSGCQQGKTPAVWI